MRHLDLFSGIGGFSLAASWVWDNEYENVGFCDNNEFCQAVLKKNFKNAKIYSDIRDLSIERLAADADRGGHVHAGLEKLPDKKRKQAQRELAKGYQLDLLTGGFPCQPFSFAGKRRGNQDDRYLWPEMLRVIQETRPRWIVGENVAGIINLALDQVLADLENEGYTCQAFVIPACAVNAPHRRQRVWIVGHADTDARGKRDDGSRIHEDGGLQERSFSKDIKAGRSPARGEAGADHSAPVGNFANAKSPRQQGWTYGPRKVQFWGGGAGYDWLEVATSLCRVDDGLPGKLDGRELTPKQHRVERIKSLGNAIVPEVAAEVLRGIKRAMASR
jgi:DNA (cytosine-5)-methyltransferase 1